MSKSIKGKTFLVFGSSGFVGTPLVEKIIDLGGKVVSFNKSEEKDFINSKDIRSYRGDIKNLCEVENLFQDLFKNNIQIYGIIILAALKNGPESFENPCEYINVNSMGVLNILEQSRMLKSLKNIMLLSTSIAKTVSLDDDHFLNEKTISPYAFSKNIAEKFMQLYGKLFAMPTTIVRATNIVGPGTSAKSVIPSIINQMRENKDLTLGNLDVVRDFVHINDVVDALAQIALSEKSSGKMIDLGTGVGTSIGEIANLLSKKLSFIHDINSIESKQRSDDASRLVANLDFLQNELNWSPRYNLDKILDDMITFYGGGNEN